MQTDPLDPDPVGLDPRPGLGPDLYRSPERLVVQEVLEVLPLGSRNIRL
jgi:hypothetical protein